MATVFVVRGVPKHDRPNYLIWEEGKSLDFVIELTSSSTRSHLEGDGRVLRLYDPTMQAWLPTPEERADDAEQRADDAEQQARAIQQQAARIEQENQRLRRELDALRHRLEGSS